MSKPLRRIGDPVVAAAPAGVRIRTRIHPSAEQAAALTAIGQFLGSVYRQSWPSGFGWGAWIIRPTRRGGRSAIGR